MSMSISIFHDTVEELSIVALGGSFNMLALSGHPSSPSAPGEGFLEVGDLISSSDIPTSSLDFES